MTLTRATPCAVLLLAACAGTGTQTDGSGALSASPRHHEWAVVKSAGRDVRCFVVFPQTRRTAKAVLVLHENKGLTDWVRRTTDRLGQAGFLAVAPDLLSGAGAGGGGSDAFATEDAATKAIYALPPSQVTADLNAVADYAKSLPGADGSLAVAGFCWGGTQTFRFATTRRDLDAAFVFYGSAPEDPAAIAAIGCPVHGFYGEDDARVNATLPKTEERMRDAGKVFDKVVYPGAGHAFMRSGEAADAKPANREALDAAWTRLLTLLAR